MSEADEGQLYEYEQQLWTTTTIEANCMIRESTLSGQNDKSARLQCTVASLLILSHVKVTTSKCLVAM
jgi:hypothetical protein